MRYMINNDIYFDFVGWLKVKILVLFNCFDPIAFRIV